MFQGFPHTNKDRQLSLAVRSYSGIGEALKDNSVSSPANAKTTNQFGLFAEDMRGSRLCEVELRSF